jgi:hypothetical protein
MFRKQLPRIYELRDCSPDSANAYFQDFETVLLNPLARDRYLSLEATLRALEEDAWQELKIEACQYLVTKDREGRGWQQLFDVLLSQAQGYGYLKSIGCVKIRFVPREGGIKTPDLEALFGSRKVLCEVKTINISDAEVDARRYPFARKGETTLNEKFFSKLNSDITKAKEQLRAHDPVGDAKHCVYVAVHFDEWAGYSDDEYFRQIKEHLLTDPGQGTDVIIRAKDQEFKRLQPFIT